MHAELLNLVQTTVLPVEAIKHRTQSIYRVVLQTSSYMQSGNFECFHPDDLQQLFAGYDREFFDGQCQRALEGHPLRFRISPRMTSAGGKTARYTRRDRSRTVSYEIVVSSTLLFQTFAEDDHRPISVSGLVCHDRLEALQRVFEHELIHLIEMLLWANSSCRGSRFQDIASRIFAHTEHTHRLITPRERAFVKFRIRPGSRVRFRLDGREHVGVVNRITKRATVLVPDRRGQEYSDGKRYATFYVPLAMLEQIDGEGGH
jgi:hypothetical protein